MKKWYPEADSVILHGTVYTVAITCDEVKAGKSDFPVIKDGGIAIKDGKIIGVGTAAEMDAFIGENTEKIDATGKVITPGFCESHMHCTFTGNNLLTLDLGSVTKRADIFAKLKERADQTPDGKWIEGTGWNNNIWDDPTEITCRELDEVSPNNPVFLMGTTFHTAFANSLALKAAGVDRNTPDPEGGALGRYEDGELNGVLYENSGMNVVQAVIPEKTDEERVQVVEAVSKYLNSYGVTSAIDANLNYDQMRAYGLAKKQDRLSFRANLMFYLDSALGNKEYHLRRLSEACAVTGFGDDLLRFNAVKVTLDGIPETFTASMRKPYKLDPTTCGSSIWTQEEITEFVCLAHKNGWQFGIHTIGDNAEDMALNAFQEAENRYGGVAERRHYLIHYMLPHEDQWDTMHKLNISVTMQPTIGCCLGEAPILFEDQVKWHSAAGIMFKNGILCGGSSDSPVVTVSPFTGMYYAVTRIDETSPTKAILGDDDTKVTPQQALIMWTMNSAYILNAEDKVGSIEVGKLADLVFVDREFLTDDPMDIKNAKVEKTMLEGKVVYEA